jgi:hypothetical protein
MLAVNLLEVHHELIGSSLDDVVVLFHWPCDELWSSEHVFPKLVQLNGVFIVETREVRTCYL